MGTAPELIERAAAARSRVAVVDRRGSHTYGELLADSHAVAAASSRGLRLLEAERIATTPTAGRGLPAVGADRRAMVFYTSGTTGRPKGAVWTHGALAAQVGALSRAWGWSGADWILSVLPLHHVHGVINVLTAALWNGARCELLPKFD